MQTDGDLCLDFKDAMRRLAATITLVTTVDGQGRPHGMAATAVSAVSMDPPSLLICVNQQASMHDPMAEAERFCVNLLHRSQAEIVRVFSDPNQRDKRFDNGQWYAGHKGLPALTGAQASIFCTLDKLVPYGSHTICIGVVNEVVSNAEVSPLLYSNASFRCIGPPLHVGEDSVALDLVF